MNGHTPYAGTNGSGTPSAQQRPAMNAQSSLPIGPRMYVQRNETGPRPVAGSQRPYSGVSVQGDAAFDQMAMPRTSPKNKSEYGMHRTQSKTLRQRADTQHVPCKFFLQGQCQAGRMCPFSHDVESTTRPAPCKYFAKGGCKFGRKCALLHIAPDGTVVNRAPPYQPASSIAGAQQPQAAYPTPYQPQGLMSMQEHDLEPKQSIDIPQGFDGYQYAPRNGYEPHQIDMMYTSASPTYGSPPQDSRFATSPPGRGLSVLDAPLPSSFDSNGISMAALNNQHPSSMPVNLGMHSPPSSLPRKSQLENSALRNLHNSAFGDRGMDNVLAGSSPPSGPDEPLTFPKRQLHHERLYAPQHQMISASLGTKLPSRSFEYSDDDDGDTDREEDLLPASLRDLIPEGRSRGPNRTRTEDENPSASFLAAQRRTISGHGTPQDSKVGSPHSSSPSRYTSMFMRSASGRNDAEGHTASPLRSSNLAFAAPSPRRSGELSPTISSPPRQASMSVLTQELQRTKLDAARSQAAAAVGMTRSLSNGSNGRTSLDRALSSNSVGRGKIDEEQELFDMDELGDSSRTAPRTIPNGNSRSSGAWNSKPFGSSPGSGTPTFGAIGGHRMTK